MDDATWAALALTLTVLGAVWTWHAFRRRGVASGLRGAGLTLLPVAAYLTDTLRMFTRIGTAVGDWVTGLVLSPSVWIGIVVAGVAAVLLVVSGVLRDRERSRAVEGTAPAAPRDAARRGKGEPAIGGASGDDDLADIEALLRKRGIS
ncbi:hypothetical protein QWY28_21140 [Nocardioides sp. SOB77]|uniref:Cellulose synthase n=1 Tax=Nocardioides oceani TaxID=3058369 RepID=A0ABT8FMR7_9ACTN|nr:hypothetical protein [Nocardioides oceani]MDN4175482.1 hypothetical protein [Nocardioides oceani]